MFNYNPTRYLLKTFSFLNMPNNGMVLIWLSLNITNLKTINLVSVDDNYVAVGYKSKSWDHCNHIQEYMLAIMCIEFPS